ncbi:MAG TPA: PilZ domain-containing protein [Candidatus Angelobacter sp.]|jgi:hypothetical protein
MLYQDRRKLSRLLLEVPLQISLVDGPEIFFGQTSNVSAQGIFFRTTVGHFNLDQEVECVLVLPEALTLTTQPVFVGCRGRIVRVQEGQPANSLGVAIEVSSYDFSGRLSLSNTTAANAWRPNP